MVNINNNSEYIKPLEWTHGISNNNYLWSITHVRCVCVKQQHTRNYHHLDARLFAFD
jgi:hypothetical protein